MSDDPEAKLFYGYLQPEEDKELYNANSDEDDEYETPWTYIHTKHRHGCIGELYGYSNCLGVFLAVEESLYNASWDKVIKLPERFTIQPSWDERLKEAAKEFALDISGLQPGWHLVCLYF